MKAGYKQTEVGVIPEGWDLKRLGTVIAIRNAKVNTFGADVASFCVELEQVGQNSGQIDGHSDARARQSVKYRFDQGDVLFGRLRPYLRKFWWADREGVCSTEIWPFIPVDGQLTSGFLFQTVQTDTFIQAANSSYGTHMPRADWSALTQFEILVPGDLAEQTAIATALSDVDGLLGGLDQLIAKKRNLKQAAMQQLLTGQTRLPGFHGEWEVKRLGEIAHIKTGRRNNEDKVADGQYPFFVRSEFVERINSYSHDCEAILVPGEGRIGDIFHYINGRFDVHQRVYAITKFVPGISGRFIHFYLAKNFGAWAMQNTVKATVDSLRLPTFQVFEMHLPPTETEQTAIASVLTEMDAELAGLEQRREKTRALKQAMMQELLTGRTRLVSAESAYA